LATYLSQLGSTVIREGLQRPLKRSTKVEPTINLKTAKSLGIQVRSCLTARADEIIE
jgi:hypothetical protein